MHSALQLPNLECHYWTDSTITLACLRQSPSRWKTFVSNRVSTVQSSSLEFLGVMFRRTPIPRSRSRYVQDTRFMVVRPSMATSFSRILAKLVSFSTLRYSSRTTSGVSGVRLARHSPVGFCVSLLFVAKIATNYRVPLSFSPSSRLRFSKHSRTNIASLLPEESQNATQNYAIRHVC